VVGGDQAPRDFSPPLGAPGSKKLKVYWEAALPGEQVYRVAFGLNNYRKAIYAVDEAEGKDCCKGDWWVIF